MLFRMLFLIAFHFAPAVATAGDYEAQGWRKEALDFIISDNPTIRDAMWTQDTSLWVSRDDDGTRHDGFAEYLCVELFSHGMPIGDLVVIHIWSHQAMLAQDLKEIGRFECARKG